MTQQAQAGSMTGADPLVPAAAAGQVAGPPARGRGQRWSTVVSAVLLLVLFAGDLLVALQLPVRESTCADRLCGPALGVAAGALVAGVLAVAMWLVGDRRRERGRAAWPCWAALALAVLPWGLVAPPLQWW